MDEQQQRPAETVQQATNPEDEILDGKGLILPKAQGDGADLDPASEEDVWSGRTHWKHYTGRLAILVVGNTAFAIVIWLVARSAEWLGFGGGLAAVAIAAALSGGSKPAWMIPVSPPARESFWTSVSTASIEEVPTPIAIAHALK